MAIALHHLTFRRSVACGGALVACRLLRRCWRQPHQMEWLSFSHLYNDVDVGAQDNGGQREPRQSALAVCMILLWAGARTARR